MKSLGDYIKKYRNKHDLSLRDFAKRCDLSHSYVSSLEKGIDSRSKKPVIPTIDTFEKIAKATNVSLKKLLIDLGYINDNFNLDKVNKLIYEFVEGMEKKGLNIKDEPLEDILDKILLAAELLDKVKGSS